MQEPPTVRACVRPLSPASGGSYIGSTSRKGDAVGLREVAAQRRDRIQQSEIKVGHFTVRMDSPPGVGWIVQLKDDKGWLVYKQYFSTREQAMGMVR